MKAVILAGGFGTRLAEETHLRPKPMVEIGGRPILWHIMKSYSHHGIKDFVICLGYKSEYIKEFFTRYYLYTSDIQVSLADNSVKILDNNSEDWTITLVDTGPSTMTGGRLARVAKYLDEDTFCFTYGDGVGDIDITESIKFHKSHGKDATVTAALPPGRFGAMRIEGTTVSAFQEKPKGDGGHINAGFFVLNRNVIDRISGDDVIWEQEPLIGLAEDNQLEAFVHNGFWQPMDTLRDKQALEAMIENNEAPWIKW